MTGYARAVVAGDIVAGKLQRLACARHLHDLETGATRGLRWDLAKALRAIRFFSLLRHFKGREWAGKPITLIDWQRFIVGSLFGWVRADGLRRFRNAYVEVPRKSGKSTLAAGLALLLTFFDGEPAAEGYSLATKRDQAKIVYEAAKQMVKKTPALAKRITIRVASLFNTASASRLEPLGADADTLDGLDPHCAIIDELHAHKTSAVVDVMQSATGARQQPLQFEITTAGASRESICWKHHEYSEKILDGVLDDDTWFAFIASPDDGDDWTQELAWRKANPNYGVSVRADDLAAQCLRAQQLPDFQNEFLRKRLNIWTRQDTRVITAEQWEASTGPDGWRQLRERCKGRACAAGLDLASTTDLSALVLVFAEEGHFALVPFFWVPRGSVPKRVSRDRVPYDRWIADEAIQATDGASTDYEHVRRDIVRLAREYRISSVGYDPWNALYLATQLHETDGLEMVELRQGYKTLSEPTKRLLALVADGRAWHGGHPVLRWMASNLVVSRDANENIKPDKAKAIERIDGMVATIMGLRQVGLTPDVKASIYRRRGALVVGPSAPVTGGPHAPTS